MQQHSVPVKFRNHAADALDLLLVTRRTQRFSVLRDLFIYFHARLAHAIRPRLSDRRPTVDFGFKRGKMPRKRTASKYKRDQSGWKRASTLFRIKPPARSDAGHGLSPQQLRQLDDVGSDPPRLVPREQLGRRSPAGLLLEIGVRQRVPGVILHDEAGVDASTVHGGGKRRALWFGVALVVRGRALAPVVDLCSLDALAIRSLNELAQSLTTRPRNAAFASAKQVPPNQEAIEAAYARLVALRRRVGRGMISATRTTGVA